MCFRDKLWDWKEWGKARERYANKLKARKQLKALLSLFTYIGGGWIAPHDHMHLIIANAHIPLPHSLGIFLPTLFMPERRSLIMPNKRRKNLAKFSVDETFAISKKISQHEAEMHSHRSLRNKFDRGVWWSRINEVHGLIDILRHLRTIRCNAFDSDLQRQTQSNNFRHFSLVKLSLEKNYEIVRVSAGNPLLTFEIGARDVSLARLMLSFTL